MNDIDPVMYELGKQQEEMRKKQEKYQRKVERREKILFFIKWFTLGIILGTIINVLTSCGSAPAGDA